MSQRNVEQVIGRLVTDEAFRRRYEASPLDAVMEIVAGGLELTAVELRALVSMDARTVSRFAAVLDPRIQKISCDGIGS
jgi:hypothetical protein